MEEGGRACDISSKSRGKGEESVDGYQFAMVHEEAPGERTVATEVTH